MSDERNETGQWPQGVSGNPGGFSKEKRRAVARVATIAREHTPQAISTLATIMNDEKANRASRIAAANALLDRAWGRPPQGVEVRGFGDPSFEDNPMTPVETARRIAFALAQGLRAQEEIAALRLTAADGELVGEPNGND